MENMLKYDLHQVHLIYHKKENKTYKGVGMIRAEIGLKNRQIINETNSFRWFLIL
jgi:helix-turn-helix protein